MITLHHSSSDPKEDRKHQRRKGKSSDREFDAECRGVNDGQIEPQCTKTLTEWGGGGTSRSDAQLQVFTKIPYVISWFQREKTWATIASCGRSAIARVVNIVPV